MADPLLDEQQVLEDLSVKVCADNVARLQMATVGTMCDLYDRKVTREHYVSMLGPCISMYGAMAKLYMMNNVRDALLQGDVTINDVNNAIAALEKNAKSHVAHVKQVMESLAACPTSQDKIN